MVKETRKAPRCQCTPLCTKSPLPNSPFCGVHIKRCGRKSKLSGYEPLYNPDLFNKNKGLKNSQNCFAYGFDYRKLPKYCTKDRCDVPFPQPGRASGHKQWAKVKGKRCPDLIGRLLGDIPSLKLSTFKKKCPKQYSKIALVVDENEDYHFYRQDSNGMWSHKPGSTDVTNIDGTGRPIYDPKLASRYYPKSGLYYDEFCSYLCAPKNKNIKFKRGGTRKK